MFSGGAHVSNALVILVLLFSPSVTALESALHHQHHGHGASARLHHHVGRHLRGKHIAFLMINGSHDKGLNSNASEAGQQVAVGAAADQGEESDTDDDDDADDATGHDTVEDKEEAELETAEAEKAKAEALSLQAKAEDARKRARDKGRMSRVAREARRQKIWDAEDKFQANLHEQESIEARVIDLENPNHFNRRIDSNVRKVANETQTKALAELLGDMYKEMRKFGSPFLLDHLKDREGVLKEREGELAVALADAKLRPDSKPKASGAPAKAQTQAVVPPLKKDPSAPMFNEETMPPVSPAVGCIMLLTAQFFIIYTICAFFEAASEYVKDGRNDGRFDTHVAMAQAGKGTVAYAPMLAILFAAVRVRAVQLSQGDTVGHQLPQPWVQNMMICCTLGVVMQLVLVMLTAIYGGSFVVETTSDGRIKTTPEQLKALPMPLYVLRYFTLAMLYVGIAAVCFGLCIMQGPAETMHLPVSPAVRCTIILTVIYFAVYLINAILSTYLEFREASEFVLKLQRSFDPAQSCVSFAPMIAILFIGVRVRALQIDPANGNPQPWAQHFMFVCTGAVLLQTIFTMALPHVDPKAKFVIDKYGMVSFEYANRALQAAAFSVWYVILFTLYAGVTVVVASVFLIQHPAGPAMTPPIAPAMHCIIELTFWYFLLQTALFVVLMIQSFFNPGKQVLDKLADIFEQGTDVMRFAPMLSVLFLAARIRANQLTKANDGSIPATAGPQLWAQQMMYMVTWSVIFRALMQCLLETVAPRSPELQAKSKPPPKALLAAMKVLSCISLVLMYVGSCAIVCAIFTMTPDTLPPYVHSPLPGGVELPAPVSPGAALASTQKLFLQVFHRLF